MDTTLIKTSNGFPKNGSNKNRLRIHGMATLERENQPNITASYDYTTFCANDFFEEDVNQLQHLELNKIALGMTIYKKEQPLLKLKNGHGSSIMDNGNAKNGTSLAVQNYESLRDPILTDVIWSRMDIKNPHANRNAYIIKQYYNSKNQDSWSGHAQKCNNFVCGFISCCIMMSVGCVLAFFCHSAYATM